MSSSYIPYLKSIFRTKFEQVLRLKPSFCREQELFIQVSSAPNLDKKLDPWTTSSESLIEPI